MKEILFTLALVSDTQGSGHVMKKIMLQMKQHRIKRAIHLGDVHWCGSSPKAWRWRRSLLRLSGARWWMAMGNRARWPCRTVNGRLRGWVTQDQARKRWAKFWNPGGDTFQVHKLGDWTLIILDLSSSGSVPMDHPVRLSHALRHAKQVLIFSHRPLPAPGSQNVIGFYGPAKHATPHVVAYSRMRPPRWVGWNRALWRQIWKYRTKIKGIFHGHYGALGRYSSWIGPTWNWEDAGWYRIRGRDAPDHLNGIFTWCLGTGGGRLQTKLDRYGWIKIEIGLTKCVRSYGKIWGCNRPMIKVKFCRPWLKRCYPFPSYGCELGKVCYGHYGKISIGNW